jgi:hypothetical protein
MTPASRSAYLLLTGLLAAPAAAQAPAPGEANKPSRLTAYLYGKEQIAALYEAGRQWDNKLGLQQDCKGPYNIQPVGLFLLKPIDFPEGKPHPVAGAWQHRYVFERCGKRMTYNAVFVARPSDRPEVRPHVPGNTNASAPLLADALKGAYPAALMRLARRGRDCKEADLIDTRLVRPPRAAADANKPAGRWEEAWTFRGCGQDVDVPVTFTPDGKGGTHYTVKSAQ